MLMCIIASYNDNGVSFDVQNMVSTVSKSDLKLEKPGRKRTRRVDPADTFEDVNTSLESPQPNLETGASPVAKPRRKRKVSIPSEEGSGKYLKCLQ